MIVVDVDHFKHLNDTRGHAAGDRAPQALVREVKAMLRANDLLARTGGEEFTILLPDSHRRLRNRIVTAERIRQAIEVLEVPFENQPIRFTISAGVAQFDSSQGDWESMMRCADAAMYDAKEHGRNAVSPRAPVRDISSTWIRVLVWSKPAEDTNCGSPLPSCRSPLSSNFRDGAQARRCFNRVRAIASSTPFRNWTDSGAA